VRASAFPCVAVRPVADGPLGTGGRARDLEFILVSCSSLGSNGAGMAQATEGDFAECAIE